MPIPSTISQPILPSTLAFDQWQTQARQHFQTVTRWTVPFRQRRKRGLADPVEDFLFVYYQYSSKKLECWHPGIGVRLVGATLKPNFQPAGGPAAPADGDGLTDFSDQFYSYDASPAKDDQATSTCYCDPQKMSPWHQERLRWVIDLLRQTEDRKPNFSCHGLHEWAMVYRGTDIRHAAAAPLRLSQSEIDRVVESRPLTCTHFDAFRFYSLDAKPMNRLQPTQDNRLEMEQPGCIHANMDLYKWAFKSMPWIGSSLLMECFHLAMKARAIDMRASPYDLSQYGDYRPIKIETPEGRREYETWQRELADEAKPIRRRLIEALELLENAIGKNHKRNPDA